MGRGTSLTGGGRWPTRRGIRDTALLTVLLSGLVAGVVLGVAAQARGRSNAADGFAGVPLLATTAGEPDAAPVDGITAEPVERVAFHIHAHLQIYVDGQPRAIPEGVGIVPPYQVERDADGPFIAGGRGSTGYTRTTAPASSTSSRRYRGSTRSASSSTSGGSR